MKPILILPIFLLALSSCAHPERLGCPLCQERPERIDPLSGSLLKIDPSVPPSGAQLVQVFLENLAVPLKGTGCGSGSYDQSVLKDNLAVFLGDGFDSPLVQTLLRSSCTTENFKLLFGTTVEAWHCSLVVEPYDMENRETFSGGSIHLVFTKDTWQLIPRQLVCL